MDAPVPPAGVPRVLVVDDTEGNRYAVSRLLRGVGMSVVEAGSGGEAFARLEGELPDLVVLDINLPDMSGHEVCRRIKDGARTAAVPVLHVSASFITNADRAFGLEHGADAYLTHPLDPDVFVATARALLRAGRADGERALRYRDEQRARRVAEAAAARATLLQDLIAALARTMAAAEVSQVALAHAATALDALAGMVAIVTADGAALELVGAAHLPEALAAQWRTVPTDGDTPLARVVRTRAPLVLRTPQEVLAALPASARAAFAVGTGEPAVLYAAPLLVDEGLDARVLGTLLLLWDADGAPGPNEMALLGTVAEQCAQALERARLYAAERAARAEAEDASNAKTQLLSTLSHELRTPLNSIIGHLDLIDAGVYGPLTEQQRDAMTRTTRSAHYLNSLINDLLSFARMTAGHADYQLTDVALAGPEGLLAEMRALVAVQGDARQVQVAMTVADAADPALVVRADAEKVRIIVANLLTNAIKFTEPGGAITVTCTPEQARGRAMVRVRVADTGRGIAAEHLERVFEPFVQVNRHDLQTSQQGVGLGLAIARTLARAMDGDLEVTSVVGTGSTFSLTLPHAP